MQLNTLYQLPGDEAGQRAAADVAAKLLLTPDIFNYWLSGVQTSETSIASTTQFWDPVAAAWCTDLLADLGIPTGFLPDVVAPARCSARCWARSRSRPVSARCR
ncbi:MAG: FGGY family carbohydrate kinase [Gammaproteobacteria bacterium]|nr:FGGY family carbohydrate kinase [Gammaproteobacteria bacterium]